MFGLDDRWLNRFLTEHAADGNSLCRQNTKYSGHQADRPPSSGPGGMLVESRPLR
jgi:hypothetical protein